MISLVIEPLRATQTESSFVVTLELIASPDQSKNISSRFEVIDWAFRKSLGINIYQRGKNARFVFLTSVLCVV